MQHSPQRAFTLIELLVVITIIAVLAGIVLPIYGNVQLAAKKVQSLTNMRQLAAAALSYCGDNNGSLPLQGTKTVAWSTPSGPGTADYTAWYNALPRIYASSKGVGDYAANPAAFYVKGSMFFVPAGKYPAKTTCLATPQFAVTFNSKLGSSTVAGVLQRIQLPAETVLFQESGLAGETPITGQSAYSNQPYSYASRTAARYNGQALLTFVDGHTASCSGTSIVDPSSGKAYFVAYPGAFPAGATKLYWEADPTASPN